MAQTGNKAVHPTLGRSGLSRVDISDTMIGENIEWLASNKVEHARLNGLIMSMFTPARPMTIGYKTPNNESEGMDPAYWGHK